MNRKKIIILSVVGGAILLVSLVVGIATLCFWIKTAEHRYYGNHWGIALPKEAQLVYHTDNLGWMGDGERYSVFDWSGDDDRFLQKLSPAQKESTEIGSFCRSTMNQLQVPLAFRLELEDSWIYAKVNDEEWPESDYVYLIYDRDASRLYVIQTRL